MRMQLVFATGNQDKVREIREILNDPELAVFSMREVGISSDPEENGASFEENALIKARAAARLLFAAPLPAPLDPNIPTFVLSDDSGLVVDALDGAPGILSARYLGRDTSYPEKMGAILHKLEGLSGQARSARFVCACAAVYPIHTLPAGAAGTDSEKYLEECVVTAAMEGEIADSIRGQHGFGYDPFFYLPELGKTSAELTDEEKNAISHRGKALRSMMDTLRRVSVS